MSYKCLSKIIALSIFIQIPLLVSSQMTNWYDSDITDEGPLSISTNRTYESILKNKKADEVIVAIIDSGVDVEHEDLKNVIWVNEDEIPNNGIDDDGNGYIDDVNGWNFIGGSNGKNVHYDTYEQVRLYKKLRDKFKNIESPNQLSVDEKTEYKNYKKWKEDIEKRRTDAKAAIDEAKETESFLIAKLDTITVYLATDTITEDNLLDWETGAHPDLMISANILRNVQEQYGHLPTLSELKKDIEYQFGQMIDYHEAGYKYHWNPDFDPRDIVGDQWSDVKDKKYGNSDVTGPDSFHGTHVAGIVAAQRNNDIGIDGIANNVKIMSIRTVPDGDERDKDVANAIIYAVNNGAKIINMSFGKGYSPRKGAVDKAVRYAEKNDVLLVHAAGNAGQNNDENNNFPNDTFEKGFGFLFFKKKRPNNWLEVGALHNGENEKMVASFSNYGKREVDVFAPGSVMMSTTPGNKYQIAQGTSMAAPVVSGVAAVLRGFFPDLKAKDIKKIIMDSTVKNNEKVLKPGDDKDKISFSDLSVSGGSINLYNAVVMASQKSKKSKIGKVNFSPIRYTPSTKKSKKEGDKIITP